MHYAICATMDAPGLQNQYPLKYYCILDREKLSQIYLLWARIGEMLYFFWKRLQRGQLATCFGQKSNVSIGLAHCRLAPFRILFNTIITKIELWHWLPARVWVKKRIWPPCLPNCTLYNTLNWKTRSYRFIPLNHGLAPEKKAEFRVCATSRCATIGDFVSLEWALRFFHFWVDGTKCESQMHRCGRCSIPSWAVP